MLPLNNSRLKKMLKAPCSSKYWQCPSAGSFKINFDGATKGNPCPTRFGGAIRNSMGIIISIFWGNIGTSTNNHTELEALINGLSWSLQQKKTPLTVEGDSLVITNISKRIQHGEAISQVSKNRRWEGWLTELKRLLLGTPMLQFMDVTRTGNRVADALGN